MSRGLWHWLRSVLVVSGLACLALSAPYAAAVLLLLACGISFEIESHHVRVAARARSEAAEWEARRRIRSRRAA